MLASDSAIGTKPGGEARERAREGPAAHRRRGAAREPDAGRHHQRRDRAQHQVRLAGELRREPRHPGDERRVVDVAPGEPPAAGHVVELVPEDAVAGKQGEVEAEHREGRGEVRDAIRKPAARFRDCPARSAEPRRGPRS